MKALLLFVVACVAMNAQIADEAGRKVAEAAVQTLLRRDELLQVRRAEDLEEYLGVAVGHAHHKLLYRVSRDGNMIKDDGVHTSVLLDGDALFIVAIDPDGGTYRIHGFEESDGEFNRLIIASGVRVHDRTQVEAIVDLYREADPHDYYERLRPVESSFEMKQTGERLCNNKPNAFGGWWAQAKRKYGALSFEPTFARDREGFEYGWIVLSPHDQHNCGGSPLRTSLHIGFDGQVSDLKFAPIN